ncbi:MAG TPA: hypothetical protein VMI33_22305 [Streptosporangiaceae bacterium]|nr:hypothetical protein [Streptosporangiaceae bacterium]
MISEQLPGGVLRTAEQLLVGEERADEDPNDQERFHDGCGGEVRAGQDHASEGSSQDKITEENSDDEARPDDDCADDGRAARRCAREVRLADVV